MVVIDDGCVLLLRLALFAEVIGSAACPDIQRWRVNNTVVVMIRNRHLIFSSQARTIVRRKDTISYRVNDDVLAIINLAYELKMMLP